MQRDLEQADPCRLCQLPRPLKRSHILPEFLYSETYDELHRYRYVPLVEGDARERPRLQQQGLTERLLCGECEGRMAGWEQYASQIFFHRPATDFESDGDRLLLTGVDYARLKLFSLSLLWRAGVSTLPAFSSVRLGPHSERIRLHLLNADPGHRHLYPAFIFRSATTGHMLERMVVAPYRMRLAGVITYRANFAALVWQWLVSSQVNQLRSEKYFLSEDGVLPIHLLPAEVVDRWVAHWVTEIRNRWSPRG